MLSQCLQILPLAFHLADKLQSWLLQLLHVRQACLHVVSFVLDLSSELGLLRAQRIESLLLLCVVHLARAQVTVLFCQSLKHLGGVSQACLILVESLLRLCERLGEGAQCISGSQVETLEHLRRKQ